MRKLLSNQRKAVSKENFVFSITTSFGKLKNFEFWSYIEDILLVSASR